MADPLARPRRLACQEHISNPQVELVNVRIGFPKIGALKNLLL